MAGVDLTTIEGIEEGTALLIRSEVGTAMTQWPSVKHCCSWLGLCPQHTISGGKVLSRRVRPGAHRVTVALRLAARTLHHSQSALGAFFRRLKVRLGTPKAITDNHDHPWTMTLQQGPPRLTCFFPSSRKPALTGEFLGRPRLASQASAAAASVSALGFLPGASALTAATVRTDPVRAAPYHGPQVAARPRARG
jgi:hypothetical protein